MSALTMPIQLPVPIVQEPDGRLVIGPSRLPIERIVECHEAGLSPRDIIDCFDVVTLPEVFAVITFYLHHRDVVTEYLAEQEVRAEEMARRVEEICPPRPDFHDEVKRRWESIKAKTVPVS